MSRSQLEAMPANDRLAMDMVMADVIKAIDGIPASVALSVLGQALVGNLGDGDQLTDEEFLDRVKAVLAMINIMRDGKANREFDQTAMVEAIHDVGAIMTCGSRSLMIPALASVLVAAVANGRRNVTAEEACVAEIKAALDRFSGSLN